MAELADVVVGLPGEVREKMTITGLLGFGADGLVAAATEAHTGRLLAVKIVKRTSIPEDALTDSDTLGPSVPIEAETLSAVHHPNVPAFVGMFADADRFYIAMERAGELTWRLGAVDPFADLETGPAGGSDLAHTPSVRTLARRSTQTTRASVSGMGGGYTSSLSYAASVMTTQSFGTFRRRRRRDLQAASTASAASPATDGWYQPATSASFETDDGGDGTRRGSAVLRARHFSASSSVASAVPRGPAAARTDLVYVGPSAGAGALATTAAIVAPTPAAASGPPSPEQLTSPHTASSRVGSATATAAVSSSSSSSLHRRAAPPAPPPLPPSVDAGSLRIPSMPASPAPLPSASSASASASTRNSAQLGLLAYSPPPPLPSSLRGQPAAVGPAPTALTRPRQPHPGDLYEFVTMYGAARRGVQRRLFRQACGACAAALRAGIVHGDVRGENVLVDDGLNVAVVDFAAARRLSTATAGVGDGGGAGMLYGTLEASAPELLDGTAAADGANAASDGAGGAWLARAEVWALGLVLFLLATGGDEAFASEAEARHGDVRFPPDFADEGCRDLILRMLCVDAGARATLDEVLAHPWLTARDDDDTDD
ncbi:Phosphoenolpyruvate carboxylase kinase 4, partial [Cladochytrium tenue]